MADEMRISDCSSDVCSSDLGPGEKTDEPIRTRGWTHWHHLFTPRQLMVSALLTEAIAKIDDAEVQACLAFDRTFVADKSSRLSHWRVGSPSKDARAPSADNVEQVFYNQALNTFYNYGSRGFRSLQIGKKTLRRVTELDYKGTICSSDAKNINSINDIYITDPPYADAVIYHEITEYFISWLRKNPPAPFLDWVWDSRRALANKGAGEDFRREKMRAYKEMADHMPDNGLQIVMFTHQSGAVWADIAGIMWAAGLKVTAVWYLSAEVNRKIQRHNSRH